MPDLTDRHSYQAILVSRIARTIRTPEILPLILIPEIFPVALAPEMLPTALTPEILPLAVALAVAPEIFPLAFTPEMLPAKVGEQSAQVRTDAQRIDLALFIVILLVIRKRLLGKLALNRGIVIGDVIPRS